MSKTYTVSKKKSDYVTPKFESIGARVKFRKPQQRTRSWRDRLRTDNDFNVDVRRDKKGEYFDILHRDGVEFSVINIDRDIKHLLLMVKNGNEKTKILCGHDEREWFTSQVEVRARDIRTAMEALKPDAVVEAQKRAGVKFKDRNKRHNDGFIRQGEWFFVKHDINVDDDLILKNEPLILTGVRAGNKPHIAQFAFRTGGEQVYIPNVGLWTLSEFGRRGSMWRNRLERGLTESEKADFIRTFGDKAANVKFRPMMRNPDLYVSGTVRHPDHYTITLNGWYRVYVNGEIRGENVVFLD